MRRSDLLALAERVRKARAEHQHALLHEAILLVHRGNTELSNRAMRMLSVGAFLDAALTLVPEGFWWSLIMSSDGKSFDALCSDGRDMPWRHAATPALALCAAALLALAEDTGDE